MVQTSLVTYLIKKLSHVDIKRPNSLFQPHIHVFCLVILLKGFYIFHVHILVYYLFFSRKTFILFLTIQMLFIFFFFIKFIFFEKISISFISMLAFSVFLFLINIVIVFECFFLQRFSVFYYNMLLPFYIYGEKTFLIKKKKEQMFCLIMQKQCFAFTSFVFFLIYFFKLFVNIYNYGRQELE